MLQMQMYLRSETAVMMKQQWMFWEVASPFPRNVIWKKEEFFRLVLKNEGEKIMNLGMWVGLLTRCCVSLLLSFILKQQSQSGSDK